MKTKYMTILVAMAFAAFACIGVMIGREWRLLLVPVAMLPIVRLMGAALIWDASPLKKWKGVPVSAVLMDITHAGVLSLFPAAFAGHFGGGACSWAAGAMAAAVSTAAMTPPFCGVVRYNGIRMAFVYSAVACMTIAPFVFSGSQLILSLGGALVMLVYGPLRWFLAVRDLRKERAAS